MYKNVVWGLVGTLLGLFVYIQNVYIRDDHAHLLTIIRQITETQKQVVQQVGTLCADYQQFLVKNDQLFSISEQMLSLQYRIVILQASIVTFADEQVWLLSQPEQQRPTLPMPLSLHNRLVAP